MSNSTDLVPAEQPSVQIVHVNGQIKRRGFEARLPELGRIRLGTTEPRKSQRGKNFAMPVKLKTLRFTADETYRDALEEVAAMLGGTVRPWTVANNAPHEGLLELITESHSVPVVLQLDDSLSLGFELWNSGECVRRCDGERMDNGSPCACPADEDERKKLAGANPPKACKPKVRISVLIPGVSAFGTWRLDSTGANAVRTLQGSIRAIVQATQAAGQQRFAVEATLSTIQKTSGKNHWVEPRLTARISPLDLVGDRAGELNAAEALVEDAEEAAVAEIERETGRVRRQLHEPTRFDPEDPYALDDEVAEADIVDDGEPAGSVSEGEFESRWQALGIRQAAVMKAAHAGFGVTKLEDLDDAQRAELLSDLEGGA